ncbi:MAG: HigA family addiction module antidote protein [Coprobacter sp.]|nr:HigA family addiction module antidote protein [Coprobacter sp.]
MNERIEILKGIHPGKVIGRDLKKRNLSQRTFATTIGEHSQTLNAVITGRRSITTEMAVKIERSFGYTEGFLLILQAYYDIEQYKNRLKCMSVNGTPRVRKILFWDTDFDKIDWGKHKNMVISRIIERGTEAEKEEIARFYGLSMTDLSTYTPTNSYRTKNTNK